MKVFLMNKNLVALLACLLSISMGYEAFAQTSRPLPDTPFTASKEDGLNADAPQSHKRSFKAVIKPVFLQEPLADAVMVGNVKRESPLFEIEPNDESLSLALRRWAWDTNYQLVWDAGKDFPARSTRYDAKTYVEAVEQVMADTESSGYPLHACLYANRVVRVLHISQSCKRN